jgi:lipoprotein-releasing system ATP-binding protein
MIGTEVAVGIDVAALWKRYRSAAGALTVLRGLDLSLEPGRTVAITGESGSGKSTLLNIVAGLDHFGPGTVRVGDDELGTLDERGLARYRRSLGLIFQFHHLLQDFDATENVLLPGVMGGMARAAARRRARDLLDAVGLRDRAHHYPAELSGGERQRVAVARAVAGDPALVLADEPTGNLDERNSRVVADLLFELVRSHGTTLVLVTHDPALVARADRAYRLTGGILVPA